MTSKSLLRLAPAIAVLSFVCGCATAPGPRPMQSDFWSQTGQSVVVALTQLPETAAHKVGAQGLLDIAINNAMADDLSNALKTITLDDSYGQARSEVVKRLQERGITSSFTEKMIDVASLPDFGGADKSGAYAAKDFRSLKEDLGADRLLLFTVIAVGTQRSYYGFVPTSRPVAVLSARGEMIDLHTNEVLWRDVTLNTAPIADPWDEPPEFQNVKAAVQGVIVEGRAAMVEKFFASAPVQAQGTAMGERAMPYAPVNLDDLKGLMK